MLFHPWSRFLGLHFGKTLAIIRYLSSCEGMGGCDFGMGGMEEMRVRRGLRWKKKKGESAAENERRDLASEASVSLSRTSRSGSMTSFDRVSLHRIQSD